MTLSARSSQGATERGRGREGSQLPQAQFAEFTRIYQNIVCMGAVLVCDDPIHSLQGSAILDQIACYSALE